MTSSNVVPCGQHGNADHRHVSCSNDLPSVAVCSSAGAAVSKFSSAHPVIDMWSCHDDGVTLEQYSEQNSNMRHKENVC